jgi:hypothetical protein
VWEQAERRLEAQIRQADALDTKAGVLVGLHALAAGLIATTAAHFHGAARWILVAAIGGLGVSGGLALAAFGRQGYDRRPSPEEMWTFGDWTDDEIRYRLMSTRFEALAHNRRMLDRTAKRLILSLVFLGVVAFMAVVSAVIGVVRSS